MKACSVVQMKLLASAAALLCVVAGVVAAPAFSTGRWHPRPVDFELAPAPAPVSAAGTGVTSRALRAPKRFNLVGMRWRGRAEPRVKLRVRKAGSHWSRWVRLDADGDHRPDAHSGERSATGETAPAWAGEADYVQYKLSRRVPGLRLHFVNTRGTASSGQRMRTALLRTVNTATASVAGIFSGASAHAQEAQPAMVTRAQWGASSCPPRTAPEYGTVKAAYIHHTVSVNDYSPDEAKDIVLAICRYHRNSNGWNDIGYNFLVDKYGTLYEGRAGGVNRAVVGAQAQGFNDQTTGISNIGDYSSVQQTSVALDAMARLIRWKLPLHGVPTAGSVTLTSNGGDTNRYRAGANVTLPRVLGHRDTNSTACPGNALYAQLPELRRRVGGVGPLPAGSTRLTAVLDSPGTRYGGLVAYRGLLMGSGGPVGGQPVQVQVLRSGRWKTSRRVRTGADGVATALLKPKTTGKVRLRFPGAPGLRVSASRAALLRVRSAVALSKAPKRGLRGIKLPVLGTVGPAKRFVYLALQVRRRGAWRKVDTKAVKTRKGRFSTWVRPPATGSYRYYVATKADRYSERGRSPLEPLRITR
ncbi:MAG TPA: N-acetylmuramoyl-L-alanine amidase [Thermoleophilaceae bacterium]